MICCGSVFQLTQKGNFGLRAGTLVLAVGLTALAALPAGAVTVLIRSAAPDGSFGASNSINSLAVSWTQGAGTTYSSVSIAATVCSGTGAASSANWYLTNSIGGGTTAGANQIASGTVSGITAPCPTGVATTLTSGLTLPPGTYFLVFSNFAGPLNVSTANPPGEAVGTGVTSNPDTNDTSTPTPVYPPSSTAFVPDSPARALLVSISGTLGIPTPPTSVPVLSTWAMLTTAILLGSGGLLLIRKFSAQP
jgi:hypothetical protein